MANYYKTKINHNENDLNRDLTDNIPSSQMKSFSAIKLSVSSYLSTNFKKIFKNSNNSSDSSGIDIFENSTSPPLFNDDVCEDNKEEEDNNKSEISTIDGDFSSTYQEDSSNLSTSPYQPTSNRIDKIGASFSNPIKIVNTKTASSSIKINIRTPNNDNSSEDFTFVSYKFF
jgi:hypothetical protein